MQEALDPFPLLRFLQERGVEHIVVGGFAVNAHGFIRVTKDLDIVPNPQEENLARLAEALRDIEATILDIDDFVREELPTDPTHAEDLAQGGNFCVLTRLGRLDGLGTDNLYAKLDIDAIESNIDELIVRVCGLENLLAMKRAAGRPQDLEDLRRLQIH